MKNVGLPLPKEPDDIPLQNKYPLEYVKELNSILMEEFGEDDFVKIAEEAAQLKGEINHLITWSRSPELALRKAAMYWSKFYDAGRMYIVFDGEKSGYIRLHDFKLDPSFCLYMTHYYKGIGKNVNQKIEAEHTKCVFKGDHICEWHLTW